MSRSCACIAIAAVVLGAALLVQSAALKADPARSAAKDATVVNGGFEQPPVGSYRFFSDRIPGWIVGAGRIEIIDEAYGHGFRARSGSQFLAFNEPGTAYQDVPTVPGRAYRLVFHIDREADATGPTTLAVTAGTANADYVIALEQHGYRQETLRFEGAADAETTRITFASMNATEAGPVIDDVRIEPVDAATR